MNVTEQCPICHTNTNNPCKCGSSVISFFKILKNVDNRVLRVKPSSEVSQLQAISAGLDKLNGYFTDSPTKELVCENAKKIDADVKRVFLKDKKAYLEIKSLNKVVHSKLGIDELTVTGFVSNPNKFHNWHNYWQFLTALLPDSTIKSAQISRVDLNLDFDCEFSKLIECIEVKCKRSSLTFLDDSGERTGLIIGKGSETITIYDKAKKEKMSTPLSRIELRLSGKKIPTKSLNSIADNILKNSFFENILGVSTVDKIIHLKDEHLSKLNTFKSICKRDGYYSAKKSLNKERNFDRDFKKLIEITPWPIQPKEMHKKQIEKFFNQLEVPI